MRVFIEEYQYNYEDVKDVLKGFGVLHDENNKVRLDYVGYYFDRDLNDCVFFLPKVLLDVSNKEEKVFGHINPADLIHLETCKDLLPEEYTFIYNLSVWIYRAICVFKEHEFDRRGKKKGQSSIVKYKHAPMIGRQKKRKSNTFLDVLLSLQQWNHDNQNYLMFILKNLHSGYNKIHWAKTISMSNALIMDSAGDRQQEVVYLNPINRKRAINFDEELLVIYYSILNYMKSQMGFPVMINVNFDLIKGKQFERYINGYGKTRLKQIKYKYFSDKALELWELCYAFFEHPNQIRLRSEQKEYLLVSDFDIVFEAIIDDLIAGDQKLPKGLLDQQDGKRVDHMYQYLELTNNETDDNIYYIGDSKYYKRGNSLGPDSVYKQFTYARNVIQWNIDLFNDGKAEEQVGHIKLRDDVTEGYNIIPNFFISANQNVLRPVDNIELIDNDKEEAKRRPQYYLSRQFENRLFDRDTFLLAHYDVNFLFVLSLYGRNNQMSKIAWRKRVREKFRTQIQLMLNKTFLFYALTPHEDVNADQYIRDNFQLLLGKVYKPFDDIDNQQYFSLALRNPDVLTKKKDKNLREKLITENEGIRQVIDQYFYRAECSLGINPATLKELPKVIPHISEQVPTEFRTRCFFEAFKSSNFLIGCYKSTEHLNWIFGRVGKRDNMYNIRIDANRDGSLSKSKAKRAPAFLFLYNLENPTSEGLMSFRIHNAADTPHEFMKKTGYPDLVEGRNYVSYILEQDPITFGEIDIVSLLDDYKHEHPDYIKGAPIFMLGSEMIKYRRE